MDYAYHLGIDLHKEFGYWTLVGNDKEVKFKGKVPTKEGAVRKAVEALGIPATDIQCAIEPVSQWGWYSDILQDTGVKVKLVDVYKSKLIAGTKLKNDKVDSAMRVSLWRTTINICQPGRLRPEVDGKNSKWLHLQRFPETGKRFCSENGGAFDQPDRNCGRQDHLFWHMLHELMLQEAIG
jgi:hypothetical protein